MAKNIEGESTRRMSEAASKGGNVNNIITGMLTGSYFKNRAGASASASASAASRGPRQSAERSAEDWYNENLMKDYDLKRENTRRRGTLKDATRYAGEGRTIRHVSADGKGGFKIEHENSPVQPAKPEAKSTITKGKQFVAGPSLPVVPGDRPATSVKGDSGKFEKNPAYGAWKEKKTTFESGVDAQTRTQLHLTPTADVSALRGPAATVGPKPAKATRSRAPKTPKA